MRNTVLLLAALGSAFSAAQAQSTIGKGTGLLTGSVGYHTQTEDLSSSGNGGTFNSTSRLGTFTLDLTVGGFVADNLALGLQLSHTVTGGSYTSSSNGVSPSIPTASTLRVGPMVQYYKMLSEQFGLTTMLGAGYESDNDVSRSLYYSTYGYPVTYYSTRKMTGYYAAITPGIIFFPVPKFGLTATIGSLGYNHLKVNNDNTSADQTLGAFDAGFGLNKLQFGAGYYFGRK
ncbi:hypothetical protein ACFP2F_03450 [Hymenobacter artigasi]|uniref:Outer membrane protein beta-barrel domain-containing protein n=1 Tax=Hymenobacter artigasi TaxID=2719616 RepID=A0ABX1HDN9_9BACT|nr:hypothetical protein [Hymenobacter artigasi]NKI88110.1 hypothetical protein [Hymenobacter artigasi]